MKLAKLLGLGQSFFGGNQSVAYRLKKTGLPRFNEGQNPFAPKPPAETTAETPAAPKPESKVAVPVARVAPPAKLFAPKPAAKPVRAGWTAKLNPFRAPEPEPRPAVVQVEFPLDTVKVVHNDLTDAEVDVVPVKSSVSAPVGPPMLPPARQAWEFLGESVLKSS